jgi:hypothetical protein
MSSAIEILSEQIKSFELIKGSKLYNEHSKCLHEALKEALLALEKKEDDVRRGRVEELKRLLRNDNNLTVEFIRARIKELQGVGK